VKQQSRQHDASTFLQDKEDYSFVGPANKQGGLGEGSLLSPNNKSLDEFAMKELKCGQFLFQDNNQSQHQILDTDQTKAFEKVLIDI